jgi:hypothetical protein
MKHLLFLAGLLVLISCGSENAAVQPSESKTVAVDGNHVIVYDFHMKHRCKTCINIENSTKKVIKEQFADEASRQLVLFELVDAEDPKNEALVEEFGAYGTTLAICKIIDGKREIEDITTWAFQRSGNEKFEPELTEKIKTALAAL